MLPEAGVKRATYNGAPTDRCGGDWVESGTVAYARWWVVTSNVRGNRPAEAGGVRLVCDSDEATAHQPYAACRSGSG